MTGSPSLALAMLLSVAASGGGLRYVDDDANAGGDGTSWATAYRFLQDALHEAAREDIAEVRVGQGVYRPDRDEADPDGSADRSASFPLLAGVALRGGFAGWLGSDPDERDIDRFETVLSGDLLADDGADFANSGDNSLHVVRVAGGEARSGGGAPEEPPLLEGFAITAGNANGAGGDDRGGAVHAAESDCTMRLCTIELNSAGNMLGFGGGLHAQGEGLILLESCTFIDNRATSSLDGTLLTTGRGGAIHADSSASVTAIGCTFQRNRCASWGGAVYGSPTATLLLIDCDLSDQFAKEGGAIFATGSLTLEGCELAGNTAYAGRGGAIFQTGGSADLAGCFLSSNQATGDGGGLFVSSGAATLTDCTVTGNGSGNEGGGIAATTSLLSLADCLVSNNHAGRGGGAAGTAANIVALRCTFLGNAASASGGGLRCATGAASLLNCRFSNNAAAGNGAGMELRLGDAALANCRVDGNIAGGEGGGLHVYEGSVKTTGCTITGNRAASGGGVRASGTDAMLFNCIAWGDEPDEISDVGNGVIVRFSNVRGGWGGAGDHVIDANPLFVGDLGLAAGSPCIDAGHNWAVPADALDLDGDGTLIELLPLDLGGQPRFAAAPGGPDSGCGVVAIVDMGAYEHTGTPPVGSITPGDLDGTGHPSMRDLLGLLVAWGPCGSDCCLADLTLDGVVDLADEMILRDNWGP